MKAVMKTEPKPGIQVGELPIPEIGHEDVLLRVKAVGICGSDVHFYEWAGGYERQAAYLTKYMPVVLGHEFAGEVADMGNGVSGIKKGDRVVYQSGSCGRCFFCNTGRHSPCEQRIPEGRIGLERKGGMAEYVTINFRQNFLREIPAGVSFEEAAQSQPTAEALHMIEQGEIAIGESVVVLGAGPIAVTVAQAAKVAGAYPVVITGLSQDKYRLSIAKSLGVDETIDVENEDPIAKVKNITGGLGAAKVFEVSGSPKALNQGLELLRKGGTLVAFGIYPENISINFTQRLIKEMKTIRGIYGSSRSGWIKVLDLMKSGVLKVAPLVTHRLPLERADEGFRACQEKRAMKVMLLPS